MQKKIISIIILFILILVFMMNLNVVNAASHSTKFASISLPSGYTNTINDVDERSAYLTFAKYVNGKSYLVQYEVYKRRDSDGITYTQQQLDYLESNYIEYVLSLGDSVRILSSELLQENGYRSMRFAYKYYTKSTNLSYYQDEHYILTDNYRVQLLFKTDDENYIGSKEQKDIINSFKIKDTVQKSRGIPFIDVYNDAWYLGAVTYCYNNKIIVGVNDYNFAPEENLTRGMLATILWRMEGTPVVSDSMKFTDVPKNMYYYDAIKWATSKKIVSGYTGTTKFGPEDNIKREDLAIMLRNYSMYKGKHKEATVDLNKYSDGNKVSSWSKSAMQWAVANNIIKGDQNKLNPSGKATRAETASMLLKYKTYIK